MMLNDDVMRDFKRECHWISYYRTE